jgi:hypothetical protein
MAPRNSWRFGALCLAIAAFTGNAAAAKPTPPLPDRVLDCQVRHITNFDPHLAQTASELQYDSVHRLVLFLPSIRPRTSLPPAPFDKPEKVDPRTRIISDPDKIAPQPHHRFARVVDYWPDRVELSSVISGTDRATLTTSPLLNVIVINPIDVANGTTNLFMTRATELTHFQPNHIYQGSCAIHIGKPSGSAGEGAAQSAG